MTLYFCFGENQCAKDIVKELESFCFFDHYHLCLYPMGSIGLPLSPKDELAFMRILLEELFSDVAKSFVSTRNFSRTIHYLKTGTF